MSADTPTYIYGLTFADTPLPEGLAGLGPSGKVWTIAHQDVVAIVSDVPVDRPLGKRKDLMAHETVVDTIAAESTILPMRFGAVVKEDGVMTELLQPHHDRFAGMLEQLDGSTQYTLRVRYELDAVLPDIIQGDENIRTLHERVRGLSEEAAHFDRISLGELISKALEARRQSDAAQIIGDLEPIAATGKVLEPEQPDEVINAAFLVERSRQQEFEDKVVEVGGRFPMLRLKLLGPLAPYDFVPQA